MSQSTICHHLKKMGKVSKLGVWVPYAFSEKNKADRLSIATSLLSRQRNYPFLDKIITGDEKWITNDNARKRQWVDKDIYPQLDPKAELHGRKIRYVWWDCCAIIHFELLIHNETVTADLYIQQLQLVHQSLLKKRPALVNRKNVVLLHDNARPHAARVTLEKVLELGWPVLPHPPYSPDLAPTDYHLFRSLQISLMETNFCNEDQVQEFVKNFFTSKPAAFYTKGIEELPDKWQQVIANDGEYIIDYGTSVIFH